MNRDPRQSLPALIAMVAGLFTAFTAPAGAGGLMDAVRGGTPNLDLRYRYETVDQDGIADTAQAATLHTRLGYTTGAFHGVWAVAEFENVATVEGDEYNSTTNGKTGRPVVADPTGTELNRAALMASAYGVDATFGRQRIVLGDGRFVGNVGFRQNEQTYDAVRLDLDPSASVRATYAYLWRVNGVTFTDARHDSHLANVAWQIPGAGVVTAYGYFINDDDAPATGGRTVGLRYAGGYALGAILFGATAEYADQSEFAGSGIGDTSYWLAELSGSISGSEVKVGYEVLEGDGDDAFQTPLATKHAFNGWADQFLTTPPGGLADFVVTLTGSVSEVTLACIHHVFTSDSGAIDYGRESDIQATRAFGPHTLGVAYATYNADGFGTDTDKLWLFAGTAF